jgi:SAM-dependent methyltransferase
MDVIDYDAELQVHNERLREAYHIHAPDNVLDIGCGTGLTTREAARLASKGEALGLDIAPRMIERARELADAEGVSNVRFEVGDAQGYPFRSTEFDVAISRFGTMFFADPNAAFRNVARAMRPEGRLVMMVWQAHDRNEWAVSIDFALTTKRGPASGSVALDPFSLGEPAKVRRILTAAGFGSVGFVDVDAPVYYGPDVDTALNWVRGFTTVNEVLRGSDPGTATSALARLRAVLEAHASERGVWFDSRAWIVTAQRK